MARADEIRASAKWTVEIYKADDQYKYILIHASLLDKKEAEHLCVGNVLGYVKNLEQSIRNDDLVYQRLHENPKPYLESFKGCADKIRELLSQKAQSGYHSDRIKMEI